MFAKFKFDKETMPWTMHQYFMMASQGMEKTKVFVATMVNTLESVIISGSSIDQNNHSYRIIH